MRRKPSRGGKRPSRAFCPLAPWPVPGAGQGETPVVVALAMTEGEKTLAFGPDYRVKPEPHFFAEVKSLLGEAAVR